MQPQPQPPFRLVRTGAWPWLGRRWLGLALTGASVVAVVYLAIRSTQPTPQSASEAGAVAFIATVATILGSAAFATIGRVTPQHARSAVRRLLTVAQSLTTRYTRMTTVLGEGNDRSVAVEARIMNAEVESALLTLRDSINDWNEVHGEALAEVLRDVR